jgi:hypothetical protein
LPDAASLGVDDPSVLKTARGFFGTFHRCLVMRVLLGLLALGVWDWNRRH